jgi:hypothetical protein
MVAVMHLRARLTQLVSDDWSASSNVPVRRATRRPLQTLATPVEEEEEWTPTRQSPPRLHQHHAYP